MRPHRRQPTRLPHPWDSSGKNTGVGCPFLLQCMKVKSESEVAQSCPTLSHPMDCSLPGSSIHGTGVGCHCLLWWRTVWRFLKKLEIELPYNPAIPLLGIHTEETRRERDTCTPMFSAALFIIARTWKQPRCPSADEWIRKRWYIYTMEYYSDIKKNTFESVLMRWMKLEPIIQSEVSQKEKHQYSILTHIYGI